jgi:UDP-N-acetylglucosamine 1-carboxyvinyltransferase
MIKNEQERQRIGRRIAELRKGKKMTQAELAERSGLGQGHIARLEAGQYGATIDVLSSIAGAMESTIEIVCNNH